MRTLARHGDYEITLHESGAQPSDKLVVTFGGQPSDLAQSGFGTSFALSLGYDTIHVAQRFGTQYQGLPLEAFHAAVHPVSRGYADVITYGSSLGGYAALYYGGCIEARCLAAAPMLPAWKPLQLPAYRDVAVTHRALGECPASGRTPTVLYDPHVSADLYLVETMVRPVYPDLREIRLPFAGHKVLVALSQARLLRPVIETLIREDRVIDFDPPAEGTAIFHGEKGGHLMKSDPAAAKAELLMSLGLRPSKRIYNHLIQCMIKLGDLDSAQAMIDHAKASGDKNRALFPARAKSAAEAGLRV
ncbi:hypothetical protein [Pseudoroseicyclus aestuarii]|uniref:Alpha/beta hydrolase n=1 Tax=Pseudoroseicyclus aestuarii TaxID=1795041 RepID=A0A318SSH9_9RHOB|nr:hypothetical protein [Pseudoroseicyclus aestuarii]PYE84492.1 hypothetical protein DFP88_102292 [Pseudoroseicyclus aestuarii]